MIDSLIIKAVRSSDRESSRAFFMYKFRWVLILSCVTLGFSGAPVFAQAPEITGGMEPVVAAPPGTAASAEVPSLLPDDDANGPAEISSEPTPAPVAAQQGLTPMTDAKEVLTPPAVPVSNDPDLFFDAESLIPQGEMGTKSPGPKKVNPELQPASRLIVVKKDAKPDSLAAKIVSADRAMKLGRYDAALEMYDTLYAKNSRDPRILMGRAVTQQRLGQYDSAMLSYQELLDINPDNLEAKINMLGLLATKYPAVALRELMDLKEAQPDNVGIVAQIAITQAQLGDIDDAIKYLGMASSMEPHNANHLFNMAVIADRGGKTTDAVQYYEKALEVDTVYGRSQSIPREAVYERLGQLR